MDNLLQGANHGKVRTSQESQAFTPKHARKEPPEAWTQTHLSQETPSVRANEMMYLNSFIAEHARELRLGKKLYAHTDEYLHPGSDPGFRPAPGWPDGQHCDFVQSRPDGSRIHAQCFDHHGIEYIRVHRDRYDPTTGLTNFVLHALLETPVGPALLLIGLVGLSRA